tara:strand:- start:32326 stop:33159 length:834 start_codon:yes stop_codon:yes gene_type:complete
MNRLFKIFLVALFGCSMISAQSVSVMTYNIRLDVASDGENAWPLRKEYVVDQIKFYTPDIFGIQEGTPDQTKYLNEHLEAYEFVGVGRDGGNKGEYSAIFYNSKKFKVTNQETFWLSETPDEVSMGWDAACNRVCTYGLFTNLETHEKLWVFNTHLDHVGVAARKNGIDLILSKIKKVNTDSYPVVLTGDFNLEPDNKLILNLKEDLYDSKEAATTVAFGPEGTFNGFNFLEPVSRRIDYIFVSNKVIVTKYAVLSDSKDLKYPSDHLPVYVVLELE